MHENKSFLGPNCFNYRVFPILFGWTIARLCKKQTRFIWCRLKCCSISSDEICARFGNFLTCLKAVAYLCYSIPFLEEGVPVKQRNFLEVQQKHPLQRTWLVTAHFTHPRSCIEISTASAVSEGALEMFDIPYSLNLASVFPTNRCRSRKSKWSSW